MTDGASHNRGTQRRPQGDRQRIDGSSTSAAVVSSDLPSFDIRPQRSQATPNNCRTRNIRPLNTSSVAAAFVVRGINPNLRHQLVGPVAQMGQIMGVSLYDGDVIGELMCMAALQKHFSFEITSENWPSELREDDLDALDQMLVGNVAFQSVSGKLEVRRVPLLDSALSAVVAARMIAFYQRPQPMSLVIEVL